MRKLWLGLLLNLLVVSVTLSQPAIQYRIPVWTQDTLRILGPFVMPSGAVDGYVLKTNASGIGTWQVDAGGAGTPKGYNLGSGTGTYSLYRMSGSDTLYFRKLYMPSTDFTVTQNDTTVRIALPATVPKTNLQNTFITEQTLSMASAGIALNVTNSNAGVGTAVYGVMSSASASASSYGVVGNNGGAGYGVYGTSGSGVGVYASSISGDPIRAERNSLAMFSVNDSGTFIRDKAVFTNPIKFYISGIGRYMHTTNDNLFMGPLAGDSITTGSYNVGIGHNALRGLKTASSNVAIGYGALQVNPSGNNVGVGGLALNTHYSGGNNVSVGYMAGYSDTTGYNNVYLGSQAGVVNRSGHDNLYIGYGAGNSFGTANENYAFYIAGAGIDLIYGNFNSQDVRLAAKSFRIANTYLPPSAVSGYGTLYVSDDGDIYYINPSGTSTNLVTAGGGGTSTDFFGKPLASATPVSNDIPVFGSDYWELEPGILDSGSAMTYRRANTDNSALVDAAVKDTLSDGSITIAGKYYGDGSALTGITSGSPVNGNADTIRTKKIGVSVATPKDMAQLVYDRDSSGWVMWSPSYWSVDDEFLGWSGSSGNLTSEIRYTNVNGSYYADFNQNTVTETEHPGSVNFSTPSTSTGNQYYSVFWAISNSYTNIAFGNLQGMIFVLKPKDTGTDTGFQIGFVSDGNDITPPTGLVIEKRPADTYWYLAYWDASSETRASTGISYTSAWQTIDIRIETDSVRVLFNGVQTNCIGRDAANCPDATDAGFLKASIYHNSTNIARGMYIDYWKAYGKVAR